MEPLTAVEARVVACLIEKQRTVPDTYPLTLNGLLAACNQATNRDPVVAFDERSVLDAVDSLKARHLARIVHPTSGRGVTRYRHVLDEALGLEPGPLAVLAVLVLRGPQTAAELRARGDRLHEFDGLGAVERALEELARREEPLVRRLDRRPGEREARWLQLVADTGPVGMVDAPVPDGPAMATSAGNGDDPDLRERVTALEAEVVELRSVVDRLRELLD